LDIPDPDNIGAWKRITNQHKIENKIFDRNKEHFGQAANTPFAKSAVQKVFGY
jgi:hypothetical protein